MQEAPNRKWMILAAFAVIAIGVVVAILIGQGGGSSSSTSETTVAGCKTVEAPEPKRVSFKAPKQVLKPGEQDNPVVETVSLNDLRYSRYGGVHYPPQAAVGSYQPPAPAPPVRRPVPPSASKVAKPRPSGTSVQIYRGMKSDSYTVGGR